MHRNTANERLESIFSAHYERIARAIGRVIHDQARAEELAVDVFLKWWRNPQAHGDGAEGWLYRAAIRLALDELRKHSRRGRFERFFGFGRAAPPTPEQVYAADTDKQQVRAVLSVLKRSYAEVLLLRSDGLSYSDIASALEINPNYVGSLLSRAQQAFRKEYVKQYGQ